MLSYGCIYAPCLCSPCSRKLKSGTVPYIRKSQFGGKRMHYENKAGNVYMCRNIEARSRNNYCRGQGISITYCECVYVALVIQHAKRMRRIITCDLWPVRLCHILPHLINGVIFGKKLLCFDFLYNFCLKRFSF